MRRIVVDPGVLVSAALSPEGNPARIVEAVSTGTVILFDSPQLVSELEDVLSRSRIARHLDAASLRRLRAVLAAAPLFEDPPTARVSRDPKDDYLIALARHAGADALVSGDRDLTSLANVSPPVLSPAEFIEHLAGDANET